MAEFKQVLTLQTESGQSVSIDLRNALILSTAPTASTAARAGMQAYVVSGGTITAEYVCTAVSGSTYTWVQREVSGGGSGGGVFTAIYNSTPYSEIRAAHTAGKWVMLIDGNLVYTIAAMTTGTIIFQNVQGVNLRRITLSSGDEWIKAEYEVQLESDMVTSIDETSTDDQYPSAKAVYDFVRENGGGSGGGIPLFTNALDEAGIKSGMRITNGEEVSHAYSVCTGFIPAKPGDIIRVNADFVLDVFWTANVSVYDINKDFLSSTTVETMINEANNGTGGYYTVLGETNSDGDVISFSLNPERTAPAYIRITNNIDVVGENPILTVNEEIKYGTASIGLDDTLTQSGKAADAAAVGAALANKADTAEIFEAGEVQQFTNQLEAAGIKSEMRITNGEEVSHAHSVCTGFIPAKPGDIIRVNADFVLDVFWTANVSVYDINKDFLSSTTVETMINEANNGTGGYYTVLGETNSDGDVISFSLNPERTAPAYIRITNNIDVVGENPILTVNEEIKYGSGFSKTFKEDVKIRQNQIMDSPARGCWNILPNEHIAIAYSYIGRKPINTVEHFTDAAENFGYNALKCDLQPTSDGELVCCHDEGFTFDANGYITTYDSSNQTLIHDVTAAACLGYSFRTGEHPCLVGDYLNVCRKYGKVAFLTIRANYMDVVIPKLLTELKRHNMMQSAIINSMTYSSLRAWRTYDQTVMLNYTMYHQQDLTTAYIDRAISLGYCTMCNFSLTTTSDRPVNQAALEYAADNGIRVGEAIAYVEGSAEWCFENGYDICHIAYPWRPKEGVTP